VENIFIGLIGSLLLLDTTILFQSSISQPLILCSLIGVFFGDIQLGIHVGIYLQLLWLSSLPIGAAVVPEGNMAAIVSAVMIFRYHQEMQMFHSVLILAVLFGLLLSFIGGELVVLYRKNNVTILNRLLNKLHSGDLKSLPNTVVFSLVLHTLLMFILLSVSLYCGDYIFENVSLLPLMVEEYAYFATIAILAAGTGLLIHMYRGLMSRIFILIGVVVGLLIPMI